MKRKKYLQATGGKKGLGLSCYHREKIMTLQQLKSYLKWRWIKQVDKITPK